MRKSGLVMLSCAALWAVGCKQAEQRVTELQRRNDDFDVRLAKVEKAQQQLKADLDALRREQGAAIEKQVGDAISAFVASAVDQKIQERIGSHDELQKVVQAIVRDELADFRASQVPQRQSQGRPQFDPAMRQQFAQRRAQWEQEQLQTLATDLKLTPEQTDQMKATGESVRNSIRDAMTQVRQRGFSADAVRQQADRLKAQYDAELTKILRPDQMEAYRKRPGNILDMLDLASQFGRGFGPPGGGPRDGKPAAPAPAPEAPAGGGN